MCGCYEPKCEPVNKCQHRFHPNCSYMAHYCIIHSQIKLIMFLSFKNMFVNKIFHFDSN